MSEPTLRDTVNSRTLILVTGKGGVGKTTVTAAVAELAARQCGRGVAVEVSVHPRLPEMVQNGHVETLNLDPEKVVGRALCRLLHLPALASAVLKNRILRLFIRTSPAMREMIVLDELRHIVEERVAGSCPVVVDLPASGHAVSLLDTPRAVARMLRVGPLAQVAQRIERLIVDPERCELVLVAIPEELPVNETIELWHRAKEIGLARRVVIANQMPASSVNGGDRALLDALCCDRRGAVESFARAAQGELATAEMAQAQVDRLRRAIDAEVIQLPRYAAADPRTCVRSVLEALDS